MSKKRLEWHLPEEVVGFLSTIFFVPAIAVIAALLLPVISSLHSADVAKLFFSGLGAGACGIILLFLARLPLYRQRRFWAFGPRELDRFHRRLHWLAYFFLIASILFLVTVWFRVR
jgi:hypothetical protein